MKLSRKQLRNLIIETLEGVSAHTQEVQQMVDNNQYLKGSIVKPDDLIESANYIVYASADGLKHTLDRHADINAPGSTMFPTVNLKDVITSLLATQPTTNPEKDFMVKWEGVISPLGSIGQMGVAYADPSVVSSMQDYQMPGGRMEMIKVAPGEREQTDLVTLVTAPLGSLSDGRQVLSLVTLYPGGNDVNGVPIPRDRNEFASAGLYFPLPPESPILQKF